ncbi:hypothetical protein L210DRAFT_3630614 [Boletus edulis BED1]|uniref:Uncharacterized protein n=1 Tax=Boletus edulis BED1 TaxID=1328754 RepID=A0AAD4BVA6_BOLED|nr:hypothetical protein L210DRAFT_3630614 [Boletus edulis BED1]
MARNGCECGALSRRLHDLHTTGNLSVLPCIPLVHGFLWGESCLHHLCELHVSLRALTRFNTAAHPLLEPAVSVAATETETKTGSRGGLHMHPIRGGHRRCRSDNGVASASQLTLGAGLPVEGILHVNRVRNEVASSEEHVCVGGSVCRFSLRSQISDLGDDVTATHQGYKYWRGFGERGEPTS